jgi:hypothetical protein
VALLEVGKKPGDVAKMARVTRYHRDTLELVMGSNSPTELESPLKFRH